MKVKAVHLCTRMLSSSGKVCYLDPKQCHNYISMAILNFNIGGPRICVTHCTSLECEPEIHLKFRSS